jgi:eukaryotic-like serine/threonine-protein kinase
MTRGGFGTQLSDKALDHLRRVVDLPDLSGTRYELRHELDRGGMGVVYAARDLELERDVALKVLATAVADAESAERLRREAQIIAGLEHPGIVPVHDVGALPDGRVFYAMKLVGGQRLDAFVRARRPLPERLRVFLRVCEPVAFAHAHGVIHRDLKPENVMVGPFGEVLVMDWGVAKRLADTKAGDAPRTSTHERATATAPAAAVPVPPGTAHGTILGTPAWMAPEQARGEVDRLDARADVYALGAILYFVLTGQAPGREGATGTATTRTWVSYAGPRPSAFKPPRAFDPTLPRPLEAICTKALSAEPGSRYANAAELGEDVALFLEGAAVSAFPEGPWRKVMRFASRHRAPLMLVAAYIIMRVILLVAFRV